MFRNLPERKEIFECATTAEGETAVCSTQFSATLDGVAFNSVQAALLRGAARCLHAPSASSVRASGIVCSAPTRAYSRPAASRPRRSIEKLRRQKCSSWPLQYRGGIAYLHKYFRRTSFLVSLRDRFR